MAVTLLRSSEAAQRPVGHSLPCRVLNSLHHANPLPPFRDIDIQTKMFMKKRRHAAWLRGEGPLTPPTSDSDRESEDSCSGEQEPREAKRFQPAPQADSSGKLLAKVRWRFSRRVVFYPKHGLVSTT